MCSIWAENYHELRILNGRRTSSSTDLEYFQLLEYFSLVQDHRRNYLGKEIGRMWVEAWGCGRRAEQWEGLIAEAKGPGRKERKVGGCMRMEEVRWMRNAARLPSPPERCGPPSLGGVCPALESIASSANKTGHPLPTASCPGRGHLSGAPRPRKATVHGRGSLALRTSLYALGNHHEPST